MPGLGIPGFPGIPGLPPIDPNIAAMLGLPPIPGMEALFGKKEGEGTAPAAADGGAKGIESVLAAAATPALPAPEPEDASPPGMPPPGMPAPGGPDKGCGKGKGPAKPGPMSFVPKDLSHLPPEKREAAERFIRENANLLNADQGAPAPQMSPMSIEDADLPLGIPDGARKPLITPRLIMANMHTMRAPMPEDNGMPVAWRVPRWRRGPYMHIAVQA